MKDKSILAVDDESELLKMLQSVFERAKSPLLLLGKRH